MRYSPHFISDSFANIQSRLTVFLAASFFFLINSATNLNSLSPYLNHKLHFNVAEIGFLFACYSYTNILFVFFAGIILDRFSLKKTLIIAYLVANCSILIFSLTESFFIMAFARLMLGIVGSFSMLICFQFIKRCFPAERIVFITGLVTTYAAFGSLISQTPLIIAIEKFGWQTSLLFNFWLGLLFCVLTIIFVQDLSLNIQQRSDNEKISIWKSMKKVIVNFQNWLIGIYFSLYALPLTFFSMSLGILYLQQAKGFTQTEGSYIVSFTIIGMIIGSPIIGWLSDKFHTRKLMLIISNFFAIINFIAITYATNLSLFVFSALFFLFGFITSASVVSYPLIAANNPSYLTSTATGFVAALIALTGIYMPFLGCLVDYSTQNNASNNYQFAMFALIGVQIINMPMAFFIKENQQKNNLFVGAKIKTEL